MRPGAPGRGGGGPRAPPPWQRKLQLCNFYGTPQGCARGQACWFAHGQHELRQPHLLLAAGPSLGGDPYSFCLELIHQLMSSIEEADSDVQARRWQRARDALQDAPMLDAQQLIARHSHQVLPEIVNILDQLMQKANALWQQVAPQVGASGPPAPPPSHVVAPPPLPLMPGGRPVLTGFVPTYGYGYMQAQLQAQPPLLQQQQQQWVQVQPRAVPRPHPPPPPPPAQPSAAARQAAAMQAEEEVEGESEQFQAAQAAIAAGDYWRLREVLQGSQWSEKEGHALMFHAAVEACNHTMLQALMETFKDLAWPSHEHGDSHTPLVFCVLEKVESGAASWGKATDVLELAFQSEPEALLLRRDGRRASNMPLHCALAMQHAPPLDALKVLAPEDRPDVWEAKAAGLSALEHARIAADHYPQGQDGERRREAVEYLASLREAKMQREQQQRRLQWQQEQHRRQAEDEEWRREQQRRSAAAAEQERQRIAAEEQRQRRLAEQERQRRLAEEERQRMAAAIEQERQRQAAVAAAVEEQRRQQASSRELLWEDVRSAVQEGRAGVARMNQLLAGIQPTSGEMVDLLWEAYNTRSWDMVQAVQQRWSPAAHGPLASALLQMSVCYTDTDPGQHMLFDYIRYPHDGFGSTKLVPIIADMLQQEPRLAVVRNARGDTPASAAVREGSPLELLKVLAPPHLPSVWRTACGQPLRTPLKLARDLEKKYGQRYKQMGDYLEKIENQHKHQQQEARQRVQAGLKAAVAAAHEAIEADDVAAVTKAVPAVVDPQYKEVRDKVLPLGGVAPWFEAAALKARSLAVVHALEEVGRLYGMRRVGDPAFSGQLLEAALRAQRWELAQELLAEHDMPAVTGMTRPPVCVALQHDAPAALVRRLVELADTLRSHVGGAAEAEPGGLPPAALAAQAGQLEALDELLAGPSVSGWGPLAFQDAKQGLRRTLLFHAIAHGQEAAALRVLSHARRRLHSQSRDLAAYINLGIDGSNALFRALEKLPGSQLIVKLLDEGADPSLLCQPEGKREQMCAVHLAAAQGHREHVQRLLEAVPPKQLPKVLCTTIGKKHTTLLHLAVEARDVRLVGQLLEMHASVITQPEASCPLMLALQQHAARKHEQRQLPKRQAQERAAAEAAAAKEAEAAAKAAEQAGGGVIAAVSRVLTRSATSAQRTAQQAAADAAAEQQRQLEQRQASERKAAAAAVKDAEALLKEFLKAWRPSFLAALMAANLSPDQRELVSEFAREHAGTVLAPLLQDKERRQAVVQLALACCDAPLLSALLAQPGFSAAGASLHTAVRSLPRELVQRLVLAGAGINQRDEQDGSLLTHKAVELADLELLDFLLAQPGSNALGRDKQGCTLMHWAVLRTPTTKREEVCRHLVGLEPRLLAVRNHSQQLPHDYCKSKLPRRILEKLEEELRQSRPEVAAEVLHETAAPAAAAAAKRAAQEAADKDMTQLGPKSEAEGRKRQRIEAMASRLPAVLAALRSEQAHQAQQVAAQAAGDAAADTAAAAAAAAAVEGAARKESDKPAVGLKEVVEAAVEQTMPEAAEHDVAHEDDAFSDTEGEQAPGGGDAELVAAADAAQLPSDLTSLRAMLAELPWEFTITRDAWHEWLGMDPNYRRMVLLRLQNIGRGLWASDGKCKRLMGFPPTLELWRSKLTRGGRIVFEVAADFSEEQHQWRDMLRLWVITLDHKRYDAALDQILDSHRKSQQVRDQVKLVPRSVQAPSPGGRQRLPTYYEAVGEGDDEENGGAAASRTPSRPGSAAGRQQGNGQRTYFPPASAGHNNYTLLKFYRLSSELVRAVMLGLDENGVDFSFRVSPEEQRIIELTPNPPRTIILLGRSGTGKTTCSVFRMWARWLAAWQQGMTHNQVFITQSATLQDQVAKSFAKLRNAVVPEMAEVFAEAAAKEYPTLRPGAIPAEAFPLFLPPVPAHAGRHGG